MQKYLKVSLSGANRSECDSDEFNHAESSHDCNPGMGECRVFSDGVKVEVRKVGSELILSVSLPDKPGAKR